MIREKRSRFLAERAPTGGICRRCDVHSRCCSLASSTCVAKPINDFTCSFVHLGVSFQKKLNSKHVLRFCPGGSRASAIFVTRPKVELIFLSSPRLLSATYAALLYGSTLLCFAVGAVAVLLYYDGFGCCHAAIDRPRWVRMPAPVLPPRAALRCCCFSDPKLPLNSKMQRSVAKSPS